MAGAAGSSGVGVIRGVAGIRAGIAGVGMAAAGVGEADVGVGAEVVGIEGVGRLDSRIARVAPALERQKLCRWNDQRGS